MAKLLLLLSSIGMLISLPVVAQQEYVRPNDTFFERKVIEERKPMPLVPVREADILWSKRIWQNIDLRQPINQPLYFPEEPTGNYRSLMKVLEDALRAGEINAYAWNDENFRNDPIDPADLFDELSRRESFIDENGVETFYEVPFSSSQVLHFRIMEEWFIDKRRGTLDVRIIGLAPVSEDIDAQTLERIGWQLLFWVPYAEIREILANTPVYTRHNDLQHLSLDDIFIRRFFDSTIYREDRPDNRVISEYIDNPIEQLIEGQRIKEEIRNMELDLWHY